MNLFQKQTRALPPPHSFSKPVSLAASPLSSIITLPFQFFKSVSLESYFTSQEMPRNAVGFITEIYSEFDQSTYLLFPALWCNQHKLIH